MTELLISLLCMVWIVNAMVFPAYLVYDLVVNMFILRNPSNGAILQFQEMKWGWMLSYTDGFTYDVGAITWIILDIFGGLVFLAMLTLSLATGFLWYALAITAALYIAREVADSVRGQHD